VYKITGRVQDIDASDKTNHCLPSQYPPTMRYFCLCCQLKEYFNCHSCLPLCCFKSSC